MLYFAYGSNMLLARIRERVPSAVVKSTGYVADYTFNFNKRSMKDGSAKATIEHSPDQHDIVWGVVFEIDPSEKCRLDNAEGLGNGYEKTNVKVSTETSKAVTYYATDKDDSLQPYHWYKAFVVAGAKQNNLPRNYIDEIEKFESVEDPCAKRRRKNEAILLDG